MSVHHVRICLEFAMLGKIGRCFSLVLLNSSEDLSTLTGDGVGVGVDVFSGSGASVLVRLRGGGDRLDRGAVVFAGIGGLVDVELAVASFCALVLFFLGVHELRDLVPAVPPPGFRERDRSLGGV